MRDAEIKEFPVSIKKIAGKNLIFSDGGYFRLFPYPLARKFKSYVGTKGAAKKLEQYLTDFRFTDVRTAATEFAWDQTPQIRLDDE